VTTRVRAKPLPPGHALEVEILELLRASGFRALRNPGAARPRQTDIYARGADVDLLVEVKDRKRSVDVGDLDSLRARLQRTTADVVGVIFTTSPITRSALKEIESDRTREIIVFINSEIEQLRTGRARLSNLIERKRQELRVQGRAWFRTNVAGEYLDVQLPAPTIQYVLEGKTQAYFLSKTDFAHAAFSMSLPDSGWGNPGGEGMRLSLRLTISTLEDFRDLFGYLHDKFGLSANGAFSIHQSGACWHGNGVKNFISAASDCWRRYREASMRRVHNSEDLVYFDAFRDGWLSLYARQRVPDAVDAGASPHFFSSDLCIQLPGVPIDVMPFLDLCRYTGNEWADFKYVQERRTHTRRLKKPLRLQVVGAAVQAYEGTESDRWTVGLIARNPFYKKRKLPSELEVDGVPPHDLREFELLLCDLQDHLQYGDKVDAYFLRGVEISDADHVEIFRPFGTWNKIIRRAKSRAEHEEDVRHDLEAILLEANRQMGRPVGRARRKGIRKN
jgi:Holliday junction resolvase